MHHDDFKFEPVHGLPEELPADEHILWQGSPKPSRLAREAWGLRWVMAYFGLLIFWRVGVSAADYTFTEALLHAVPLVILALAAAGVIYLLAYVQARSTVYTLTNKRVGMRIGAALTMTLNLPYVCIANAQLDQKSDGTGTLAMELSGDTRLSFLMTWPHVRPWTLSRCQPALRCIPDAASVAEIFAEAAETRITQPQVARQQSGGSNTVAAE